MDAARGRCRTAGQARACAEGDTAPRTEAAPYRRASSISSVFRTRPIRLNAMLIAALCISADVEVIARWRGERAAGAG